MPHESLRRDLKHMCSSTFPETLSIASTSNFLCLFRTSRRGAVQNDVVIWMDG